MEGIVLILNNENFDIEKDSQRKHSREDVKMLKDVFCNFNCNVKIVIDPTLQDIRTIMNESLFKKLPAASYLAIVLMTHGLENDNVYAKDQVYNICDEILKSKAFQDYRDLPKILIVQACKNLDQNYKPNTESKNPKVYNTFRFNSCFEGGKSVRTNEGTLFIESFCKNLRKYGLHEDIKTIAHRVHKDFVDVYKKTGIRQYPTIVTYREGFDEFRFGNHVKKTVGLGENNIHNFVVE